MSQYTILCLLFCRTSVTNIRCGDPVTLQGVKLAIDETALHVREVEERLETTSTMDPAVEAQEDKVSGTFQNQYDTNVAALEAKFGLSYDRVKPYDRLGNPTLSAADAFNIGKAYSKKGPIGCIIMARQDVMMERERLAPLTVSTITKANALTLKLQKLEEEEEMRQTARGVLAEAHAKNKALSAKVKDKQHAKLAPLAFGASSSFRVAQGSSPLPTEPALAL